MATKAQSAEGPATTDSGGEGVRRRDFLNVAAVSYYYGDKAGLYREIYCGLPHAPGSKDAAIGQTPGSAARKSEDAR